MISRVRRLSRLGHATPCPAPGERRHRPARYCTGDVAGERRSFQAWVEAWNRDDFDTWIDQFSPEVEWFALMEVFRGHAGARQAWESFATFRGGKVIRFRDFSSHAEALEAAGLRE
jgi:hypothetical protein